MVAGAVSLKKPHHIVILRFSEIVKDHANDVIHTYIIQHFTKMSVKPLLKDYLHDRLGS